MSTTMIYGDIIQVMREIDAIEKTSRNKDQGYQFRGIDDIYAEFHPIMAKVGIFCVPRVVSREDEVFQSKSGGRMLRSVVSMEFDFVAIDGSKVTVGPMIGEGNDMSDKASNKAMSVAQKYAFIQTFVVPTREEKDPDFETVRPPVDAIPYTKPAPKPSGGPSPIKPAVVAVPEPEAALAPPLDRKDFVMTMGVHKDQHFDNIPLEALNEALLWLNGRDFLSPNQRKLKHMIEKYFELISKEEPKK